MAMHSIYKNSNPFSHIVCSHLLLCFAEAGHYWISHYIDVLTIKTYVKFLYHQSVHAVLTLLPFQWTQLSEIFIISCFCFKCDLFSEKNSKQQGDFKMQTVSFLSADSTFPLESFLSLTPLVFGHRIYLCISLKGIPGY